MRNAPAVRPGRDGAGFGPIPTVPRTSWRSFRLCLGLLPILWLGTGLLGADAAQNALTWQDNSDNETHFHVDRTTASDVTACQSTGGWMPLATVEANVVTFVDTAVGEGTTYCYRVQASNAEEASGYSNIAGRTVPYTSACTTQPSGWSAGYWKQWKRKHC